MVDYTPTIVFENNTDRLGNRGILLSDKNQDAVIDSKAINDKRGTHNSGTSPISTDLASMIRGRSSYTIIII